MFTPVNDTNILQEIYRQIHYNVQAGNLQKGDQLPPERQMAAALGVSRTSLREVLKALELIGLLECTQGMGNRISNNMATNFSQPLSIMMMLEGGTVDQIHHFRHAMEIAAVQDACDVITPAQVEELEELCESIERDNEKGEEYLSGLDRQLHMRIAQISGNPLVITMMTACEGLISGHVSGARAHILVNPGNYHTINRHHREVVSALAHHDRAGAMAGINAHMEMIASYYKTLPQETVALSGDIA